MGRRTARRVGIYERPLLLWLGLLALLVGAPALLGGCALGVAVSTSAIPTASPADLRLSTDRSAYAVDRPVGVILTNAGQINYYGLDGHSACTLIQLQRYDSSQHKWLPTAGCAPEGQPRILLIPAGAREPFTLSPSSASDPNAWQPGLYRVALTYSANTDGVSGAQTAYSTGFLVGQ